MLKAGQPLIGGSTDNFGGSKRKHEGSFDTDSDNRSGISATGRGNSEKCAKSLLCTLTQGIQFHIFEMVGSGILKKMTTPRGALLRLR
jgi:hypothetical protein